MHKQELAQRPRYALNSVDAALQLLQLLRDEGQLRVQDAAARLGVAPSTVHRLVGMLVYRGFAVQDEQRVYRPGMGMNVPPVRTDVAREYRELTRNACRDLVGRTGETANLIIRFGTTVRFLETYVAADELVVSSRRGQILPAHQTSGGKILLAFLNTETLERLYRSELAVRRGEQMTDREFGAFTAELDEARQRGYAISQQVSEPGVCAVGIALRTREGLDRLALSVSIPADRFAQVLTPGLLANLARAREEIDTALTS
jgi:IclR family transcriptional regulator, acetate operon repressor